MKFTFQELEGLFWASSSSKGGWFAWKVLRPQENVFVSMHVVHAVSCAGWKIESSSTSTFPLLSKELIYCQTTAVLCTCFIFFFQSSAHFYLLKMKDVCDDKGGSDWSLNPNLLSRNPLLRPWCERKHSPNPHNLISAVFCLQLPTFCFKGSATLTFSLLTFGRPSQNQSRSTWWCPSAGGHVIGSVLTTAVTDRRSKPPFTAFWDLSCFYPIWWSKKLRNSWNTVGCNHFFASGTDGMIWNERHHCPRLAFHRPVQLERCQIEIKL